MDLQKKVLVLPNICGVEIDISTASIATPTQNPSLQPFYNTVVQNSQAIRAYTTPTKIKYSERGKSSKNGVIWKQQLILQFPNNDPLRALRINQYLKARYIYLKLSTGMYMYFGRNDYFQNCPPKVDIKNDDKITKITYSVDSISPIGFTNGSFDFQTSEEFPINFFNL